MVMVWGSTHSVAPLLHSSCKRTCICRADAQVGAGLTSILWLSLNSSPGQSTLVYWGRGGGLVCCCIQHILSDSSHMRKP